MSHIYFPGFEVFSEAVVEHIRHRYSTEMSHKSQVVNNFFALYVIHNVPLGVQLKSENKLDETVSIMESLQQYVPHQWKTVMVPVTGTEKSEMVHIDYIFPPHQLWG